MALSSEEQQKILDLAAAINERNRKERAENKKKLSERITAARSEIDRLIDLFQRTDPNLKKIVLFGSLARDAVKRLDFDIDLAVDSERYMDLLGIALDSDFKIDLIDLMTASAYIKRSIARDGVEVYRAKQT